MEKLEWCLPDGEKISKIRLFVLSTNVTDGRTDRQTDDGQTLHDSKDRAYASHRAVKIAVFTYHSPHFCFPWRRPCDYHAICCMDGKTIQCLPNPSQHVPKSMGKSKNRYFYHIFVSPGDAPGAITLNVVWMEREFDAYTNCLAACHVPI